MAGIVDEEFVEEEYDGLDYVVISRPQELIDQQIKLSSSKLTADKSDSATSKRSTDSKHSSKGKDKRVSSKHERKGSSKGKLPYKTLLNEGGSSMMYKELAKKFEFVKKNKQYKFNREAFSKICGMASKHKSESSKVAENECNSHFSKNKQSDIEINKQQDIQPSKIMTEPAVTPLQRFRVLDARDIALRAKVGKPEDSKSVKIIGTCPDMCPEKERYGRIAKNCVSVLEMKTTFDQNATSHDADHCYMIKEYSRSSADQQEPLPHELRPISVLNLTMDYLICNVMDKCWDSITLEEWYDFIWNRTRSIRKGITQQELCDPQCVEIIEKCVRFHIHCAEALSEEDSATFDPKINNENLTKCLQTLKHMYHDLQSKGIECPNEAEFRSYDILLSLTEGETLGLIKDIRKELLKSPVIKSAFEAALAFKSHNYVKFFKIIEKANYLSSCILHRYIIEARIQALQIIVRAYSTQHNASMYPTASLVKDLKFENEAEASEFCRCHGLDANDIYVTIHRKQFSKSASGLPVSRSSLLVASKKGESLGLIVNNGMLPSNPKDTYQPHSSFDERNILKINSLCAITKEFDEKLEEVGEEMEIEDASPLHVDSTPNIISIFEKSASTELQIKDSGILELEKRRSELLEQLSEIETENAEKLKQKRNRLIKHVEEIKSSKISASPTKSHKSVMFSSENSGFPVQETDYFKPSEKVTTTSDQFFKPDVNFGLSEKLPISASLSFFKCDRLSSVNVFSPVIAPPSSKQVISPKTSTTIPNMPVMTSVTSDFMITAPLTSGFDTFQSQAAQNFSFQVKPTTPTSYLKSTVTTNFHDGILFACPSSRQFPNVMFPDAKETETLDVEETVPKQITKGIVTQEISEELDEDLESSIDEIVEDPDEMSTRERKETEVTQFMNEIADKMLLESVEECSISVCEEILNEERNLKAQLNDNIAMVRKELARKAILRWRTFTQRKRDRRLYKNSAFFSPWQAMLLNTPYIPTGAVSPIVAYRKHCSLSKSTTEIIKKRREITPGWEKFVAEEIWPLNIFKPHLAYSHPTYFGTSKLRNFYKVCLVFPPGNEPDMTKLKNWMCAKFDLKKMHSPKFQYKNVFLLHDGKTAVSVVAVQLYPGMNFNHARFLNGVTAMMLFVPKTSKNLHLFLDDFISLRNESSLDFPFPLHVYFVGSHEIPSGMADYFEEYVEDRSFTAVNMQCIPAVNNFIQNSKKIFEGLMWFNNIEEKAVPPPLLKKLSFRHYVQEAFAFTFNKISCKLSSDEFKFLKQEPKYIINFYNKIMKFRASVLCEDFLKRVHLSWPPDEIRHLLGKDFINMQTQNICKSAMESLLLPNFQGDPSDVTYAWEYARQVPCPTSTVLLGMKLSMSHVDWHHKIAYCAEHLTQSSEFMLLNGDMPVYYTEEDLLNDIYDQYWLDVLSDFSNSNTAKRKNYSSLESPSKKTKVGSAKEIVAAEGDEAATSFGMLDNFRYLKPKKLEFSSTNSGLVEPLRKEIIQTDDLNKENSFSKESNVSDDKGLSSMSFKPVGSEKQYIPVSFNFTEDSNVFDSLGHLNPKKVEFSSNNSGLDEPLRKEINQTDDLNKENSFSKETNVSDDKGLSSMSFKPVGSEKQYIPISFNFAEDSNWMGIKERKPPGKRIANCLADAISELQYNVQKHCILEDHFSQLLHKQL